MRAQLAALSLSAKIRILEKLRDRSRAPAVSGFKGKAKLMRRVPRRKILRGPLI